MDKLDGKYQIVEMEPDTWASRNLHLGDTLLSVNGEEPSQSQPIKKWNMLEQATEISVKDGDSGRIHTFEIVPELDIQMVFQIILPVIVFLLSLYCSYLVYKNRNESTKNSSLLLILFLLDISVAYIIAGASARGEFLSRSIIPLFFVLVPVFYLHFIYHYFKELNSIWFSKKWIALSYLLAFINTSSNILSSVESLPIGIDVVTEKAINLASFMLLFLLAFGMIVLGLKKNKHKAQKYHLKVLVYTNVLAFLPFVLLYIIPYILFHKQVFSPVILSGFLLIIPFALVYQFLVQKIYDIEFIIGRVKYYAFLSIIPSLLGIFLIISTQTKDATIFTIRGFLIITVIMYFGFYLKEILDFKFKFIRISEKHNYQESVFQFTQKIRTSNEFEEVIDELKTVILNTLLVNDVFLLEVNKNDYLRKKSSKNHVLFDKYKKSILKSAQEVGSVVEVVNGFVLNIGEAQNNSYVLVALANMNTPKLTRDELSWLKTLAYYTNVTIESFFKIEQFMEHLEQVEEKGKNATWLNRVIYQLEEKQRSLLAKDLHDSVLQDLLSIKRKIEMNGYTNDKLPDENSVSQKLILEDMNRVIITTRETCHELRPNVLYDLGLEKAIKRLVDQHIYANGYNIRFTSNKIDGDIQSDIQLNLYRITQELLNNTKKHSNAKNIVLMLVKIKDKIVLHYEDDGIGADSNKLFGNTGSMGLSGVRERVEMLSGTIEVTTEKGKGFKVLIEI